MLRQILSVAVGAAAGFALFALAVWLWPFKPGPPAEPVPDEVDLATPTDPADRDPEFVSFGFVPTPVLRTWPPTSRDPFFWPFSATSPWNHPIGRDAQYGAPDDPVTQDLRSGIPGVQLNVTEWTIHVYRSRGPARRIYVAGGEFITEIGVPDHARPSAPLLPDDCTASELGISTRHDADAHLNVVTDEAVVMELYRARRLCDGNLEANRAPWWHDLHGDGLGDHAGHHSGSRAYGGSSLGGLLRAWELEAGQIRHALAAALPAERFTDGYVWPATSQDGFAAERYRGNVPMGTLAALPPDFDLDSIDYASPYGRSLAQAMRDYGVYLVDSAGSSGMKFYGEPSIEELPEWESIDHDLRQTVQHLLPVLNNGPDGRGGGGEPRAPLAPPFR